MFESSDAMTSISLDALIVAAAFLVWAIYDIKHLQLSLITWFALCAGLVIALAMPIPLYLAARTVRQSKLRHQMAQVIASYLRHKETKT